jgi:hypothetical protein
MGHSMNYFVSGDSYSDLNALKNAGIIDFHFVIHGGGVIPNAQVVVDCNNVGLSPILNNGNDGTAGWWGSNDYNQKIAAQGWHAVGGESEQAPEIDSIMDNLIFLDYGGQGTAGGTNDNIWYQTHTAPVHGHGCAAYLETYDNASNFWGWNVLSGGVLAAKAHGVKEIGIMVGSWMLTHSSAQNYIDLANAFEANGVTCAGLGIWAGYNNNANVIYNRFASWYNTWMSIWPPSNVTMKNRFAGVSPPPPAAKHVPHIWCGMVDQPDYSKTNLQVGGTVGTEGRQGWLDTSTSDWATSESLTAAEKAALVTPVLLGARDANGNNMGIATVTPNADGDFSAIIPSPSAAGSVHYNWKGATGNFGAEMVINWTAPPPTPGNPIVHLSAEYTIDHKTGLDRIRGMARDADNKPSTGRMTGLWSYNEGTKEWKGIAWVRVDSNGYYEYDLTALLPPGSYILQIRTNDGVSLDATEYERK